MNLLSSLLAFTARQIGALRTQADSNTSRIETSEGNITDLTTTVNNTIVANSNSKEVLWSGELYDDTITLSKNISNFDFIDIEYQQAVSGSTTRKTITKRIPAVAGSYEINDFAITYDNPSIDFYKQTLTLSATSLVAAQNYNVEAASGSNTWNTQRGTYQFAIVRVLGVKLGSASPSELTDIRVGADGTTYDSAGNAVRGQLSGLKSELSETDKALGGITKIKHKINYTSGRLIYVGNDIGTTTNTTPQVDASWECTIINCSFGEEIEVNAKGAVGARAWAFLDSENKLLSRSDSGVVETVITAPQNATKCVLNNKKSDYVSNSQNILGKDNFAIASQAIGEASDYVIQNVELTRGYYSYSGVPSHKSFTSLDYYESASVNCAEGEKYSISGYVLNNTADIGFFWDENDNLISSIGTSDANEYSNKLIEIPTGCVNFTITSYRNENRTHTIIKKWLIVGAESEKEKHPLIGKKFLSFGDSITAFAPRWRDEFLRQTGAEEIHCYAVGGATLVDWEDTVLDGNIQDGAQNTVCNQVAQFLLNPPEEVPDFVVISAGTNDSWSADDLTRVTNTQFVNESHQWIDIDSVDRKKPDGAMRWQAEKIWSVYPNTVIIFGAPIQCAESIHTYHLQEQKNNRMKIVGNQLSCKVIMGAYDSGIYGRYETANVDGKYLVDGIHPNTAGGIVLGKLYAREICNLLKF